MHDSDIGGPDPLRVKVFSGSELSTDDRLGYLIEFVAQLDDRLKEAESMITELVTCGVNGGDDD